MYKWFFTLLSVLLLHTTAKGQVSDWPTPEVEQMYRQAKDYLSKGGIQQAISLFRQAIQLAPDVPLLHRDLGQALNITGAYSEAYDIVAPLINSRRADEQTYQIAGAALAGKGERKKARNLLERGIGIYPHSGMLYYELGKNHENSGDNEYALDAWLQGIENDPAYHLNYYEAARIYSLTDKPIWTILYGEIFVTLERHTPRSTEARRLMLNAYEAIFKNIGNLPVPKYGTFTPTMAGTDFETAVMQTMMQLAPVVSDGITTENLIMLRTRFTMDWLTNYSARFPYSMFTYHDKLLRAGHFDAYNQWLFGKTENAGQFAAWTSFHPDAIATYESWALHTPFYPTAGDFYNKKELSRLFRKKK